jgi:hypothetical protein
MLNAYRTLVRNFENKRQFRIYGHRRQNNIKNVSLENWV